jgi:regulator of sigma D
MQNAISAFSDRFYTSRQRLLRYLLKLGQAIDSDTSDLAGALTTRFCDSLVDYLSTGHFQVLERFTPTLDQVAAFEATTRQALAFCDEFGAGTVPDTRKLKAALERLVFVIDSRMDVEDEVIQRATQSEKRLDAMRPAGKEARRSRFLARLPVHA